MEQPKFEWRIARKLRYDRDDHVDEFRTDYQLLGTEERAARVVWEQERAAWIVSRETGREGYQPDRSSRIVDMRLEARLIPGEWAVQEELES